MATTTYASPGVYVEEVHNAVRPIQAVGTSLPAFIGITEEASLKRVNPRTGSVRVLESCLQKPVLVANWTQFTRTFGGFTDGVYLPDAVYAHFTNGGGACYVVSIRALKESDAAVAAKATISGAKSRDAFSITAKVAGSGGNNLVLSVSHDTDTEGKPTGAFSLKLGGESHAGLSMKKSDDNYVGNVQFSTVTLDDIGPQTAVPEAGSYSLSGGGMRPLEVEDFIGDALSRTGLAGLEAYEEIRLIACPDLMADYDGSDDANNRIKVVQQAIIGHCQKMRYRFAVLDLPPGLDPKGARDWRHFLSFDTSHAACYYPWVEVSDLINGGTKKVPPSGHIVGMYGRVDAERGVHKAPANEQLMGVTGLELQLSRGEQDILNPLGVNCIRAFPGRGIRVWGGRTLSSDGAWRYISVRRLFIMVAASMDAGLQWVVFEPNDSRLWSQIGRDVNSFLRNVWRSGGLFGDSADQAYYIKCDAELNTEEVRDTGQLIIEVGIAPVKPAEFVIFRLSQWSWLDAGDEDMDDAEEDMDDGETE